MHQDLESVGLRDLGVDLRLPLLDQCQRSHNKRALADAVQDLVLLVFGLSALLWSRIRQDERHRLYSLAQTHVICQNATLWQLPSLVVCAGLLLDHPGYTIDLVRQQADLETLNIAIIFGIIIFFVLDLRLGLLVLHFQLLKPVGKRGCSILCLLLLLLPPSCTWDLLVVVV